MNEVINSSKFVKTLTIIKRIILGDKSPSKYLKILCWANFSWSIMMVVYYLLIAIFIRSDLINLNNVNYGSFFKEIKWGSFIYLAFFHILIIISVVLIWRRKIWGFYTYIIINFTIPSYLVFYLPIDEINSVFLFSMLAVLLFLISIRSIKSEPKINE